MHLSTLELCFFLRSLTGRIHVRGGGGLSSLFDEFRVVTVAMTSPADGRSRFPRRRGPLLLLLLLLSITIICIHAAAAGGFTRHYSRVVTLRYSRGFSSWWETRTPPPICFYLFFFFGHCGTVAQSHCCCHHALSCRRRVASYPFLFLLLFSTRQLCSRRPLVVNRCFDQKTGSPSIYGDHLRRSRVCLWTCSPTVSQYCSM